MRLLALFLSLVFSLSFLAGCGKKGALYLPDAPAQSTPSQK
ncbi:MAG: lipoprotein [Pseudomonadota bacterium]